MAGDTCHISPMTYSLKQLARWTASGPGEDTVATTTARIQHWSRSGLFELAGVDIGPLELGRGRVRQYPKDALMWCKIWNQMADQGIGFAGMVVMVQFVHLKMVEGGKEKAQLEKAFEGKGKSLFYVSSVEMPFGGRSPSKSTMVRRSFMGFNRISYAPIDTKETWRGGWFINITAIFKN